MMILKLCALAFVVCALLTPVCRKLFIRFQILDQPDGGRKHHKRAVPRIGGIPLFLTYFACIGLFWWFSDRSAAVPAIHDLLWPVLPGAGVIFLAGVLDDMMGLNWKQKLVPQLVGACIVVGGGVHVWVPPVGVSFAETAFHWLGLVLSVCWIIGCTNATNLIDGVDGLAAGVSLTTTLTCLVVGVATHDVTLVVATAPLAAAILGFLLYNFSPASIFLGDCGSLTLGFMTACFTLLWSRHTNGIMHMLAPGIAVALPLLDVCLSISRRYLREAPIADGDRGHIHHVVLSRTSSATKTSIILYCVAAMFGCLALTEHFEFLQPHGVSLVMAVILVVLGIKALRYTEFTAARQALSRKRVMGSVRDGILMSELDGMLDAASTPDEVWYVVSEICSRMKLEAMSMSFMGFAFETPGASRMRREPFLLRLHFGAEGELVLRGTGPGRHVTSFARIEQLQNALSRKLYYLMSTGDFLPYGESPLTQHTVLSFISGSDASV